MDEPERDAARFLRAVTALPEFRRGAVIGIDGFMGAGKSRLARWLAIRLQLHSVSTDRFIAIRNGNLSYASRIAYGRLRREITHALRSDRPILLEGICLRAIAKRLTIKPAAYIYVKRISAVGLWHDGLNFDDFARGEPDMNGADEHQFGELAYHARFVPHSKARLVFATVEGRDCGLTTRSTGPAGTGIDFGDRLWRRAG